MGKLEEISKVSLLSPACSSSFPCHILFSQKGLSYGSNILHWVKTHKIIRFGVDKKKCLESENLSKICHGLGGGSSARRPGSEDPHRHQRNSISISFEVAHQRYAQAVASLIIKQKEEMFSEDQTRDSVPTAYIHKSVPGASCHSISHGD